MELSSNVAESELLSVKPGLSTEESDDVETGLTTVDSQDHVSKAFSPEIATAGSVLAAAEDQFAAAAAPPLDQQGSPAHENLVTDPHTTTLQAAAAVEDTRLVPARPITPITATGTSAESIEEGDKELALSTTPPQDLVRY